MAEDKKTDADAPQSMDSLLMQQARLESTIREQFRKILTVMFTDLKGSTTITETQGDLVSRMMIREHNEIVMSAIRDNSGVFVKSIGDGTLSYFERAQDALRAAVRIQQGMDALNMEKKFSALVLVRIGMHTGACFLENGDLFGDTINTASRFESSAHPGEILLSADAYNALSAKGEIYCRFDRVVTLKGKKDTFDAFRAFWNPDEIEKDKTAVTTDAAVTRPPTSKVRLALLILIPALIVLLLALRGPVGKLMHRGEETRTIQHTLSDSP